MSYYHYTLKPALKSINSKTLPVLSVDSSSSSAIWIRYENFKYNAI